MAIDLPTDFAVYSKSLPPPREHTAVRMSSLGLQLQLTADSWLTRPGPPRTRQVLPPDRLTYTTSMYKHQVLPPHPPSKGGQLRMNSPTTHT